MFTVQLNTRRLYCSNDYKECSNIGMLNFPFLNSFIKTENVLTSSRLICNQQFYKIKEAIYQPEKEKCIY